MVGDNGGTEAWHLGTGVGSEKVGADMLTLTPQFMKTPMRHRVNLGPTDQRGAGTNGEWETCSEFWGQLRTEIPATYPPPYPTPHPWSCHLLQGPGVCRRMHKTPLPI